MENSGSGNYTIDVNDGTFCVRIVTAIGLGNLRKRASRDTILLEEASYEIKEGVLYMNGLVSVSHLIVSGYFDDYIVDNEEELQQFHKEFYIGDDSILKEHKQKWYHKTLRGIVKPSVERVKIKTGYYLSKQKTSRKYVTSNFRIIK